MSELVVATTNPGKLEEWRRLLAPLSFVLRTGEYEAPQETGATYLENAALKAVAAARATGVLAIADDTGIEIDAMGGAPGIATARWVEENGGWDAALARLAAHVGTGATLVCAVVLADRSGVIAHGEARVRGRLRWPPSSAPVPAAIFDAEDGAVIVDGVLAHRRAAFAAIEATLRARG
jgi:XTP/dITP diphosphohydrolase